MVVNGMDGTGESATGEGSGLGSLAVSGVEPFGLCLLFMRATSTGRGGGGCSPLYMYTRVWKTVILIRACNHGGTKNMVVRIKKYDDRCVHTVNSVQPRLPILHSDERGVHAHAPPVADTQTCAECRQNGTWWLQNPADAVRSTRSGPGYNFFGAKTIMHTSV